MVTFVFVWNDENVLDRDHNDGHCVSYFSSVRKHSDPKPLMEKSVYLGLQFQREKSPSWRGGSMASRGRHCGRSRKLKIPSFLTDRKQEEQTGSEARLCTLKRRVVVWMRMAP